MAQSRKVRGILPIGPGRFEVRAHGVNPKTGKPRKLRRYHGTEDAPATLASAVVFQQRLRDEITGGVEVKRARVTLATYARTWIERGRDKGRRRSTRVSQAYVIELHVKPWLGDYFMDAITPSDVETWLHAMATRTDNPREQPDDEHPDRDGRYDPVTIDLWLQKLRALVAAYYKEFRLGASPLVDVERPRAETPRPRPDKALTAEDAGRLLEHCRETRPQWHALLYLGLTTGARIGELTALRWVDVDWGQQAILIHRSQVQGHEGPTKTGEPRVSPLTDEMGAVLRAHRQRLADEAYSAPVLVDPGALRCERGGCGRRFKRPRIVRHPSVLTFCYPCRQVAAKCLKEREQEATAEAIAAYCVAHPRRASRKLGTPESPDLSRALIFPSGTGNYMRHNGFWKALRDMCVELKIKHIGPHGMRHTFNDLLRRSGTDALLRRAMVGHKSEETNDLYAAIRSGDGHREVAGLISQLNTRLNTATPTDDGGKL